MITSVEFDDALQLIADYKIQLDKQLEEGVAFKNQKIDIRQDVKDKTFKALKSYYERYYDIKLEVEDLNAMDRDLLAGIDYDKIAAIRGFGRTSIFNFKKIMISHSVLGEKDL